MNIRYKWLFITMLLIISVRTHIYGYSRDDFMLAINNGNFSLAIDLLDEMEWQYKENDEYILDFDKYFQFYTYCTSQCTNKTTLDVISNYWAQLSIKIGNWHKSNNNLDQAEQWLISAVEICESLTMPKYALQKSLSYNQLGCFYYEKKNQYIAAVNCYDMADSIWRENNLPADELYWIIIQNKANACEFAAQSYRNSEDWLSARYYFSYEAFELKRLNGNKDAKYALAVNREAIMTSYLKDYVAAWKTHFILTPCANF